MQNLNRLSDYQLAAEYASVCRDRPRNQREADEREALLHDLGRAMDARDVRLEDWDVTAR